MNLEELPTESVGARYAGTILARLAQLGASAVSSLVVPRFLGPLMYGNFSFLQNMSATIHRRVLDCFANQGAFAMVCAKNGASEVTAVEVSAGLCQTARANAELNGLKVDCIETNATLPSIAMMRGTSTLASVSRTSPTLIWSGASARTRSSPARC